MLLYSLNITNRLSYITQFIGKYLFNKPFELTKDIEHFVNYDGPKINYSNSQLSEQEIWLKPHGLLFEESINNIEIDCFTYNGNKAFFKISCDYPFDIFAASFFLLSRYEEHLPHEKDMYGRYAVENSVAYKNNFLKLPLVNIWLNDLSCFLSKKFARIDIIKKEFEFIPTYDIDEAFSYKHKGLLRTVGGTLKSIFNGNPKEVIERFSVLLKLKTDPFQSFKWMDKLHKEHNLNPRYFFLVPSRLSRYDRNILPHKEVMKKIIDDHSKKYKVGIHPSWQSGDIPSLLKDEIKTLQNITHQTILSSRQHFIRFNLPETYQYLIELGIKEEFSMGYGSINGFRASLATPFLWFNLKTNKETELVIYPFCYMDANSFFEQKLTPDKSLEEMKYYYSIVKSVNGCLVMIWHNTFLGSADLFKGWRDCYLKFIQHISFDKK